ncbi:DUF6147 family protein [Blautia schinkii]|nr:DUF6147 family protein [Blautia schinkii]
MKKKILKKLWILAIVSSIIATYPVSAASLLEDVGITETDADFAENTNYSLLRGNNLNYGNAKISKLTSNEINVFGLTQCHHECDKVFLQLSLEQKNNGSYSTYKYWEFTADNVTHLYKSINVIVPTGHYYRVRGYHAAKDGAKESTTTLTDGILVK